jgi:transposase InsO family protein
MESPLISFDDAALQRVVFELVDRYLGAKRPPRMPAVDPRRVLLYQALKTLLRPVVTRAMNEKYLHGLEVVKVEHDNNPAACVRSRFRSEVPQRLGSGRYGSVFRVPGSDGRLVAKVFKEVDGRGAINEYTLGRKAARLGIGPEVHSISRCCNAGSECFVVITMDALTQTLESWMTSGQRRTSAEKRAMRAKIARKVEVMHKSDISHNDLHIGNIMLNTEGDPFFVDYGRATSYKDFTHPDMSFWIRDYNYFWGTSSGSGSGPDQSDNMLEYVVACVLQRVSTK